MSGARFSRSQLAGAGLALLAVVFSVTWWGLAPDEPPRREVKPAPQVKRPVDNTSLTLAPPVTPQAPPLDPAAIDPEIQEMADKLAAKTENPSRDLEIVNDFIDLYRKVFQQGNPIGLNEDITSVLTGHNARNGVLFPPGSPMIVKGQLVDRWGTPYWFHPNSAYQMEIRSAGPDRQLFTPDDVVMNPGPDNMGIGAGAPPSPTG